MRKLQPGEGDWQAPGDFVDANATLNKRPPVPRDFRVTLAPDGAHLLFTIRDIYAGSTRNVIDSYYVWFSPSSLLADGATISDPDVAARVFAGAELADNLGPSSKPGDVSKESDRRYLGRAGWFFATSLNQAGTASLPTPPVAAPSVTGSGDSAIPADVTGAQAVLVGENVEGKSYVRVFVTANVPIVTPVCSIAQYNNQSACESNGGTWSTSGSFDGYQIYLKGYRNNDLLEEGPFFQMTTQRGGEALSGSFLLRPDVPPSYSTGLLGVTESDLLNYTGVGTNWSTAWGAERWLEFWADDVLHGGVNSLYRGALYSVTSPTAMQAILTYGGAYGHPGSGSYPYVIYSPQTQDNASIEGNDGLDYLDFQSHLVTLYFVAVSRGGTRRADPTLAPRVVFKFGLSASLSKPLNPVNLSAWEDDSLSRTGSSVNLSWNLVQILSVGDTQVDSTVKHFNVYKLRVGTVGDPDWSSGRPGRPFATVRYNDAQQNLGGFSWTDRTFNTDPTIEATTVGTGWDFDPADPAQYVYYVTSVNMQGTENLSVYWGQLSAAIGSATITNSGGDAFVDDMIGMTIAINGTDYTVEAHPSPTTLTIDPVFVDPTLSYQFTVGPVTGRVAIVGNAGAESDPTIYRDQFSNRLFNAQLLGTATAALQGVNTAYVVTAGKVASGQPTYCWYFTSSQYQGDDPSLTPTGVPGQWTAAGTGGSPPAPAPNANNDKWSVWEAYIGGAGGATPTLGGDGSISINPVGHDADDFSTAVQLADRGKFLVGEQLVFQLYAKTASAGGAGSGVLKMQMTRYDARNFSLGYTPNTFAGGLERDDAEASFNLTTLSTDYTQFVVKGKLPANDQTLRVTATSASPTVTAVDGDARDSWLGNKLQVSGGTLREIIGVSGGSAPDSFTTITLSGNAGANVTNSLTAVITQWTHYYFKVGIVGEWSKVVSFKQPMVNSGLLGAVWTSNMNHEDWPGGTGQPTPPDPDPSDPAGPRPGCVPAGTMVETDRGPRPIELCAPGTRVRSRSGGAKGLVWNVVTHLNHYSTSTLYTVTTPRRQLVCSASHRPKVNRGKGTPPYVEARDLVLGDTVYAYVSGVVTAERVVGITKDEGGPLVPVYSLTVERTPHNYFAGGVLTHNKPPVKDQ